jgi:outer membrane receptor protein involved in Fe transport
MKKNLIAALCCFLPALAFGQNTPAPAITVKGVVIDSTTNVPQGFVTVALQNTKTKMPVKSNLTKDDGSFELKAAAGKQYQLVLILIGYNNKIINLPKKSGVIDLGKLKMSTSSQQLMEVSVTAAKPVIKQEVDRISYDVQADPESKALTVFDILRKVPLVSMDADDNILLKGNSNYKILINGKPSSLVANSPSDVFKAMPASSIQRIEVITNPPAKYDAEGLAGIINIITAKKVDNGYNGNLNLGYRTPAGGLRGGGFFTVKQGKLGASAYFGSGGSDIPSTVSRNERITTGFDPSDLIQNGSQSRNNRWNWLGTDLSYDVDSLHLITANLNYNFGNASSVASQSSSSLDMLNDSTLQAFDLNNVGRSHSNGGDAGINYQLGFKRNKDQLLTFSYNFTVNNNYQYNDINLDNRINYPMADYTQLNTWSRKENTFQIDYAHPLNKLTVEGGLKAILRSYTSESDYDTLNAKTDQYQLSPALSNDFNYKQDILGAYNSYSYNANNWAFKAGGRLEETIVDADFISTSSVVDQNYFNVVPSASVNRKFSDMSSINFGFTQRISRPDISTLNPFVDRSNPDFISTGNPKLRPVLSNNLQLNYNLFKKVIFNFGINYMFSNNNVLQVSSYNPLTDVTSTIFENIGKNRNTGANFYLNYPITPSLNFNLNGSINYLFIQGVVDTTLTKNHGFQGNAFGNLSYKFTPGWRVSANYGYNSRYLTLQGNSNSFSFYSFNMSKEIVKNKLTFSAGVNNPFTKFRDYVSETSGDNFTQTSFSQRYFRTFNFALNYRFGKLTTDIKKNKRDIDNDDVPKANTNGNQ